MTHPLDIPLNKSVFNVAAFNRDRSVENDKKADEYYPIILKYIKEHPKCSMMEIYEKLELFDIPMYLALHMLWMEAEVSGISPYSFGALHDMREMYYKVYGDPVRYDC